MQMLLSGVQSTAGLAVVSVLGSVSFGLICCSGGYCTWALRLSLCACRLQQFFPGATSASETCSFRKTMGTPRSSIRLSPVLECVQRHMPAPSSHGPSLTGYCSNHHVPLAGLVLADVEVRAAASLQNTCHERMTVTRSPNERNMYCPSSTCQCFCRCDHQRSKTLFRNDITGSSVRWKRHSKTIFADPVSGFLKRVD